MHELKKNGSSTVNIREDMNRFIPHKKFYGSVIPDCLQEYKDLSLGAKLCWGRLSELSGAKGYCFPSQEFLALKIGKEPRQTRRYIEELEDKGFIIIQHPSQIEKYKGLNNIYGFIKHPIFQGHIRGSDVTCEDGSDLTYETGSDLTYETGSDLTDENGSDVTSIYNVIKDSSLKDSCVKGSLNLKGLKQEPIDGADAPASRKKSVKRIKPKADDMAAEITKLKENYPLRYRGIIDQAISQIALTRKDQLISEGIIWNFLSDLEKFQLWQIGQGIRKYVGKGYAREGKGEKYLLGIIRGQNKNGGEFAYTDMRLDVGTAPPSQAQSSPITSGSWSSQPSAAPPVEKPCDEIDFRGNPLGKKSFRVCGQTGHYVATDEWEVFLALRENGLIIKGEYFDVEISD
jgi:Helix-turn-helix domain